MPVVIPKARRLVCSQDESYSLPLSILDDEMLSFDDEEIIEAMALYKPKTKFKEGDFVLLMGVPDHLKNRPLLPRCWKIRFVVSNWAIELIRVATRHGGKITLEQAVHAMHNSPRFDERNNRKPWIYAHGYPHGEYPDSAAWLPEGLLRRTIFREFTMPWTEIIEEAGARYMGYDTDAVPTPYYLDSAPDNYSDGHNLGRPFAPEEPLVNTLHFAGLGEMLDIPFNTGGRVRPIEGDHDIFDTDDDLTE